MAVSFQYSVEPLERILDDSLRSAIANWDGALIRRKQPRFDAPAIATNNAREANNSGFCWIRLYSAAWRLLMRK